MCFVEFEDVSFATKTLHELYGYQLSNSVKGGIRLSFSKNPLGVRNTPIQDRSAPNTPAGAIAGGNGLGGIPGPMFSTASGPPPGLSAPPGLAMPNISSGPTSPHTPISNTSLSGIFHGHTGHGLGINPNGLGPTRPTTINSNALNGTVGSGMGGMTGPSYADFMVGR